jgi:hypothetical protein
VDVKVIFPSREWGLAHTLICPNRLWYACDFHPVVSDYVMYVGWRGVAITSLARPQIQ